MTRALPTLALGAGVTAACLGLGEIGLRLAGFPSRAIHSISAADYDRLPGMYEPGSFTGLIRRRGLPHDVEINRLGFRGPAPQPGSGRARVLFIGDSVTFGDHVNDADTLPAQVEAASNGAIEALNGGVAGSTIVDQRVFARRMLSLAPGLIVLVYSENDLSDLGKPEPISAYLARNRARRSSAIASALFFGVRDLALFQLALRARGVLEFHKLVAETPPAAPTVPPALLARYCSEVTALRADFYARGLPLLVALYPWPETLSGRHPAPTIDLVREALAAEGMAVVDLTPALRASGTPVEPLYLFPHDSHPSPLGYRVAARALAPAVVATLAELPAAAGAAASAAPSQSAASESPVR